MLSNVKALLLILIFPFITLLGAASASAVEKVTEVSAQQVTTFDIPYKKVENESALAEKSYITLFVLVGLLLGILWVFNKKMNKGAGLFIKNTKKLSLIEQGKIAGNKQYTIVDFEGRTILIIENRSSLSTLELSKTQ